MTRSPTNSDSSIDALKRELHNVADILTITWAKQDRHGRNRIRCWAVFILSVMIGAPVETVVGAGHPLHVAFAVTMVAAFAGVLVFGRLSDTV